MKNIVNKWLFNHRKRIQLYVLLMQFIIVTAMFIRLTGTNKKQFFVCRPDLNRVILLCTEQ